MKIRTAKYIFREGVSNTYRNKLMSFVSLSVIVACLFVFGLFYIATLNANANAKALSQEPEIKIYCNSGADDTVLGAIEKTLKGDPRVSSYTKVSMQDVFNKMKDTLGSDKDIFDGFDMGDAPAIFYVRLKDPSKSAEVVGDFNKLAGVKNARYSQKIVDFVEGLAHWVRVVSIFLIILLLAVSVFIIANTIKLTVFARRREINIMKFIGATDGFIRWPFVVEGVIIGCIGAVVAFILLSYGYNALERRITTELAFSGFSFLKILKLKDIGLQILAVFAAVGVIVGSSGSIISLRRYLHV